MINAKQARENTTKNFLSTMEPTEKTVHFFIEAKVREAISQGSYYVRISQGVVPELWEDIVEVFNDRRLPTYYEKLGYSIDLDSKFFKTLDIIW